MFLRNKYCVVTDKINLQVDIYIFFHNFAS